MDLPDILRQTYPRGIEKGPDKSFRVSPSRILKCPRGAFMESLGYKGATDVVSEQNLGYGKIRHTALQKKFVESGIMLNPDGSVVTDEDLVDGKYKEEELTLDDPPLLAYMDGRISAPNEKGQAVLEIKTINKKVQGILHALYTHPDQAMFYMHITGLPEAYILYEAKNEKDEDLMWRQHVVQYDPEWAEKLLNKGRRLMKALKERKLPFPEAGCFCQNPACYDQRIYKKENLKGFLI